MKKKTVLIAAAITAALIGVITLTVFLLQTQQDTRSRASISETLTVPTQPPSTQQVAQQCPVPAAVQNVKITFPSCAGDICNFTQASCSWSSVAGATKYQEVITEVDTNTVVKNEQIDAAITNVTFPVKQNFTYKCDISAINSCGTSGTAGSNTLLCKVDALVVTPTTPPPSPTIAQVDCGFPCASNTACKAGLICALGTNGQGLCSLPTLQAACVQTPSISSCCTVPSPTNAPVSSASPTLRPTIQPTGNIASTAVFGIPVLVLILLGGALLLW